MVCDFCGKEKEEDMVQITDFDGPLEIDIITRYMCAACCDKYTQESSL